MHLKNAKKHKVQISNELYSHTNYVKSLLYYITIHESAKMMFLRHSFGHQRATLHSQNKTRKISLILNDRPIVNSFFIQFHTE